MTSKELFIKEVEDANINFSEEAAAFFESMKVVKEKPVITEKGLQILAYLKENRHAHLSKEIAVNLNWSSRVVSGCVRKLVTDGFVEKIGENPSQYMITDKGISFNVEQ